MPNKTFILLFLFMMGSCFTVRGQNSSITPDYLKSNLIQFLITENVIDDESKIGMAFYLIDLNTPVESSDSHIVFPVETRPKPIDFLKVGFYKFGISSAHLEPYLVVVFDESFDILSDYSIPAILKELELFMRGKSMGFDNQLILTENVLNVLSQRQRILESQIPLGDDLINHKNE